MHAVDTCVHTIIWLHVHFEKFQHIKSVLTLDKSLGKIRVKMALKKCTRSKMFTAYISKHLY